MAKEEVEEHVKDGLKDKSQEQRNGEPGRRKNMGSVVFDDGRLRSMKYDQRGVGDSALLMFTRIVRRELFIQIFKT
jgi:hypothetical protein